MAIIDTGSVDPAMGNNRPAGSGAARAKNAAGADDGVGFGHRGRHRANRKDGGDVVMIARFKISGKNRLITASSNLIDLVQWRNTEP
jgi:hypothetical protein